MHLDIFPEKSYFYDQAQFSSDSISLDSAIEQRKSTPSFIKYSSTTKEWNISYIIEKLDPGFKTNWYTNIERTHIIVEETPVLKWNILPDTQKIETYNCQKATAELGAEFGKSGF